ncbi:FecR domain-containing protein [Danxiaibacter flavus]|uniref:FecR domain-containing protein n=1 Tax=Danxiaibacter flavus TaxID=3049108 RepID=A0ABV3ZP86_9BACT|nr:FecR domain-containing protein [Chitinophagaceae bacterium DXS]
MNPELEKFVLDEKFVSWILNPNGVYAEYWKQYFAESPHEKPVADEAAILVQELHEAEKENYAPVRQDILQSTWQNIEKELQTSGKEVTIKYKHKTNIYRYAVAAAVVIFATTIFFLSKKDPVNNTAPVLAETKADIQSKQIITNTSTHFRLIHLSDGTAINLAPQSTITAEKIFTGYKREVTLTGNAFFQVAKDASKPFYVYTGSVVTRVVGTSFSIVTMPDSKNITVSVKTGKVMVYKKGDEQKPSAIAVLLPSQQCSYLAILDTIETRSLSTPDDAVIKPITEKNQHFDRVTVPALLDAVARRFDVEIKYTANDFQGTDITITLLTSQSLESMLHVISKTVNANYRIEDNKIIFTKSK